jgi:hypothetical protein
LGSIDKVKRRSKNDFMRHPTPRTMHPICHGNMATVSEMGPTTVMGADKAQGSKEKLIYGSELPRATTTRVSDEATQRMDNILVHPAPHRVDPTSSSFISGSRLGSFTPLCGLASSRTDFLRGLPGKEA